MNDLSVEDKLYIENERLCEENLKLKRRINGLEKRLKEKGYIIRKINERLKRLDPKDKYYNSNGKRKAGKR